MQERGGASACGRQLCLGQLWNMENRRQPLEIPGGDGRAEGGMKQIADYYVSK